MNENERNEQWRERIRAYRESGLTMRAWCAAQEIPFNMKSESNPVNKMKSPRRDGVFPS